MLLLLFSSRVVGGVSLGKLRYVTNFLFLSIFYFVQFFKNRYRYIYFPNMK